MDNVGFYPYSEKFPKLFEKERAKIKKSLPDVQVVHIGSTAVPGVGGKGIIDILIALSNWEKKKEAVRSLQKLGFTHIHPEKDGRIFLSRKATTGYGNTHIHLVEKGNKEYKKLIAFRDYLRKNPDQAEKYSNLKDNAVERAKGNRSKYAKLKERFIQQISRKTL